MAERRARIKRIANIPVRRKNEGPESKSISPKPEANSQEEFSHLADKSGHEICDESIGNENDINESTVAPLPNITSPELNTIEPVTQNTILPSKCHIDSKSNITINQKQEILLLNDKISDVIEKTITNIASDNTDVNSIKGEKIDKNSENIIKTQSINSEKPQSENKLSRRWISKPSVRLPAITRRPKPEIQVNMNLTPTQDNEKPHSEITSIPEVISENEVRVNPIVSHISKVTNVLVDNHKPIINSDHILTSPLSPSKTINRARIRPIPRLIRRNSMQGSASESEDDGRKSHNRIRNDSVCSTASHSVDTVLKDETVISKETKYKAYIQRKFKRTEQSRKMAEARREFYLKFGSNVPDKKQLTMMDLIFYNPSSNPMPEKITKIQNKTVEEVETIHEKEEEEKVDNPDDPGSDEENIPVPQVKVGPNGEIILDEQSLVIEQTGTKKGREQLKNSQVVIDDLDTGYGIYKRPKRSKDWCATETLRFYRTLNTVGTDFSLMLSLFPGRTRRELKLKFKKEERINRQLIDKALMNPLHFDLAKLEDQLQEDEKSKTIKEVIKKKSKIKEPKSKLKRTYSGGMLARQMEEENLDREKSIKTVRKRKYTLENKTKKHIYSALEGGILSILDESEEDTELQKKSLKIDKNCLVSRPTRTCRLNSNNYTSIVEESDDNESEIEEIIDNLNENESSDTEMSESNDINNDEEISVNHEVDNNIIVSKSNNTNIVLAVSEESPPDVIPESMPPVEPGSLMILSSLAPNGQQVFKVYMVTPSNDNVPVKLPPEVVHSLTASLGSAEEVTLDLPVINE